MGTDPMIYRLLSGAMLLVAPAFIVLLGSSRRGAFKNSIVGVGFMLLAFGCLVYAVSSFLRNWFGYDYPGRSEVRVFAQATMLLGMSFLTVVLGVERFREWRNRRN